MSRGDHVGFTVFTPQGNRQFRSDLTGRTGDQYSFHRSVTNQAIWGILYDPVLTKDFPLPEGSIERTGLVLSRENCHWLEEHFTADRR
jgi:hypothetical protein